MTDQKGGAVEVERLGGRIKGRRRLQPPHVAAANTLSRRGRSKKKITNKP